MKTKLQEFECAIQDVVSDLLYYDRKEDESLTIEDVKNLFKGGEMTPESAANIFLKSVKSAMSDT